MRTVHVEHPLKTETSYIFKFHGIGEPSHFGFRSTSPILHGKIWDSVLPLLHLTRNDSPLHQEKKEATIRFDYPVHERVVAFFVNRCRKAWGYKLHVRAPSMFDRPRRAGCLCESALCFGGGKDSRCLLGLLSRVGKKPQHVVHVGRKFPDCTTPVQLFEGISYRMSERLAPALMMVPQTLYLGSAMGEVHRTNPWHFHYDLASLQGRSELSTMLRSVGIPTSIEAPLNVLPYSLVQRFLLQHFPRLAQGQRSSLPNAPTYKNLQVAMLWLHAGREPWAFCSKDLFRSLLAQWIHYLNGLEKRCWETEEEVSRRLIDREMMALAWRLRDLDVMSEVADKIPRHWQSDHIDYVHDYIDRHIDRDVLGLMLSWAPGFSQAPRGTYRLRSAQSNGRNVGLPASTQSRAKRSC